jgi:DNA polymerase III epsilon subunit-like protein
MHHHTLLKPNSSKIYFYLITGEDFEVVQKEVSEILNGRLLIGHAIHNDLKVNNRDNDMCILNFVDVSLIICLG